MLSIAFALIVLAGYVFMFALCGICGEQSRREEEEEWQRYLTERRTESKRD